LWNNPRVEKGIRVDEKLYAAFKPVAIAKFGSVCHPIEVCMATLLAAWRTEQITGVNPSHTSIDIGNIIINRNTQERRKLKHAHTETDTVELEYDVCCFAGCNNEAKTTAFYNGESRKLCDKHVALLTAEGSTSKDWRFY
jgi:hypothetical protein